MPRSESLEMVVWIDFIGKVRLPYFYRAIYFLSHDDRIVILFWKMNVWNLDKKLSIEWMNGLFSIAALAGLYTIMKK